MEVASATDPTGQPARALKVNHHRRQRGARATGAHQHGSSMAATDSSCTACRSTAVTELFSLQDKLAEELAFCRDSARGQIALRQNPAATKSVEA